MERRPIQGTQKQALTNCNDATRMYIDNVRSCSTFSTHSSSIVGLHDAVQTSSHSLLSTKTLLKRRLATKSETKPVAILDTTSPRNLTGRVSPSIFLNDIINHYAFNVELITNNNCNNNNLLIPENLVLNLSKIELTSDEVSILSRGLTFCPTPAEPDMGSVYIDLERFFRTLRLKVFFDEKSNNHIGSSQSQSPVSTSDNAQPPFHCTKFTEKSTFDPLQVLQGPLDVFQKTVKHELSKYKPRKPRHNNLSKGELIALKSLANNTDIVIKKADKGSCVVVMNTQDYLDEGFKQLSNTYFYMKVNQNLTEHNNQKVHTLIDELEANESISTEVANYLKIKKPRTPAFYLLPKIHKNVRPPPGRPILSANDSPTERISAFVDHFLQPMVPLMKSYVKDTTDFIKKIESLDSQPEHIWLVSLDVVSLYTNIPHAEGLKAVSKCLTTNRPSHHNPSNTELLRLLAQVLTLNCFEFNNTWWLQKAGVSMGSKVSPTFANLFMDDFENRIVYKYPRQPITWWRFIDDVFLLWSHTEEELHDFVEYLNNSHPTIKFTKRNDLFGHNCQKRHRW